MKVVPLKTRTDEDAETVAARIEAITHLHTNGEVKSLLFGAVSANGEYRFGFSDNMTISEASMLVTFLQQELFTMISKSD